MNDLSDELAMVENEFVEVRKQMVTLKMESNIKIQLYERGIGPSLTSPTKIIITKK